MNYSTKLKVKDGCRVIATRGGQNNGHSYEAGTRGVIRRSPEESPKVFTEDGVDLGYVNLSNWEKLLTCSACREQYPEADPSKAQDDDEDTGGQKLCPPCKRDPQRAEAARQLRAEAAAKETPAPKKRARRAKPKLPLSKAA